MATLRFGCGRPTHPTSSCQVTGWGRNRRLLSLSPRTESGPLRLGPCRPTRIRMDSWLMVCARAILPAVVPWHPRTGLRQAGSPSLVRHQSLGRIAGRPKEPCITKRISPSYNSARGAMLSIPHRHISSPRPSNIAAYCCCPGRQATNWIGHWVEASLM